MLKKVSFAEKFLETRGRRRRLHLFLRFRRLGGPVRAAAPADSLRGPDHGTEGRQGDQNQCGNPMFRAHEAGASRAPVRCLAGFCGLPDPCTAKRGKFTESETKKGSRRIPELPRRPGGAARVFYPSRSSGLAAADGTASARVLQTLAHRRLLSGAGAASRSAESLTALVLREASGPTITATGTTRAAGTARTTGTIVFTIPAVRRDRTDDATNDTADDRRAGVRAVESGLIAHGFQLSGIHRALLVLDDLVHVHFGVRENGSGHQQGHRDRSDLFHLYLLQ